MAGGFSTLLLQISVKDAEVIRVVEVTNSFPQFAYWSRKAFDYDALGDVFVVGSKIIRNPFRSMEQWDISSVGPVHSARAHTEWNQTHLGVPVRHPQAQSFQELPAMEEFVSVVCFAGFFRLQNGALQVATVTQRSSLSLVWTRAYREYPRRTNSFPSNGEFSYGVFPVDSYQWVPDKHPKDRYAFLSRWDVIDIPGKDLQPIIVPSSERGAHSVGWERQNMKKSDKDAYRMTGTHQ